MRAALAQASMALWRAKHRKAVIFRRKMSGFEVFLGLREYEVRSNPCLMPICRATHHSMKLNLNEVEINDNRETL